MHTVRLCIGILFLLGSSALVASPDRHDPSETTALATSLWEPNGFLLVGELHGTEQAPALIAALVRERAASNKSAVVVGLEIPVESQTSIDLYLRSGGSDADRRALLADNFWAGQDGRASQAMFDLINVLRGLRSKGSAVRVECFDAGMADGETRDARMASRLRSVIERQPNTSWIVLSGNMHTRVRQSQPPRSDQPMGSYLVDLHPVSLVLSAPQGSAWNCQETCGRHTFDTKVHDSAHLPALVNDETVIDQGYDAKLRIAEFSASPPARQNTH